MPKTTVFKLGQLLMSQNVSDKMAKDIGFHSFVCRCFERYRSCDWGDLDEEGNSCNEYAIEHDGPILAVYRQNDYPFLCIWIITEWDRSVTTILFPEEY